MTIQRQLLPNLLADIASVHADCSIVLIGSVAAAAERADSDIDLNLVFPGDEAPKTSSCYVTPENRWQLKVVGVLECVRIDVAWETEAALWKRVTTEQVVGCWPFSQGEVLRDLSGQTTRCLELAKRWFAERPDVAVRFEAEYTQAKSLR